MQVTPARRVVAEALGTALLVAAVIGSGIMAERLAGGVQAIALLANTIATGGALVALLIALGPVSGAHFNPIVTVSLAYARQIPVPLAMAYIAAQIFGGIVGAGLANAMFGLDLVSWSQHARHGSAQLLSEAVATFGLVGIVIASSRRRAEAVPYAVAAYIVAAYWFTASTSFANPTVTIARAASDTFAGIRPVDVLGFIVAQAVGGVLATVLFGWLVPMPTPIAPVSEASP
jgi:glycerol uptake facilitator-like aquaporin